MGKRVTRRQMLKILGTTTAAGLLGRSRLLASDEEIRVAGRRVEVAVSPLSPHTVRITMSERGSRPSLLRSGGALADALVAPAKQASHANLFPGHLKVGISRTPLALHVFAPDGRVIQSLSIDDQTGAVTFPLGNAPVLGLGEGGPQFDRRGNTDRMRSGQGGFRLRTHGGRVPIQWLIGTSGWAMFIHEPLGSFDLTGADGVFHPPSEEAALPIDIFVVDAAEPTQAIAEYARITGHPEMPPLWALGYEQSHRTLASPDEILSIAKTFREKKLPCDALIYLGTGFCPSGWNTENGSFQFNPRVFTEPKRQIGEFHALHFRVVMHSVILTRTLRGSVHDPCPIGRFDAEEAACLWDAHRKDFALGVDGWWPDEGDPLDAASRLTRIRMHYEGPQLDRPNERPYALHRNGYAGMQRFAPFLWSGDVYSTWETLRTHVPIAINTGLSGIPLWGTDTGGFVPTKEFTGELYVRWFQFSAFCPLFRSHGRDWKLRLPWGWNTGEIGPNEINNYSEAANPDPSELHNAAVEPICRKYLELRYRLMPYLYSAVRESSKMGLPIMRALWLHYSDDPAATARGDQYLWGRDILVAPVTEKGATTRSVYLPKGLWFDFWTEERQQGGREVSREVDLETMPLHVRAGSILPFGPLKQYTSEVVDEPLTLVVYPGTDGSFTLYEDDGITFDYRRGEWSETKAKWNDRTRRLSLRSIVGTKAPYKKRKLQVRLAGETAIRTIEFSGHALEVQI
jgi:alpha-glucosidase/alpha-D-xyloside xylohydrolase